MITSGIIATGEVPRHRIVPPPPFDSDALAFFAASGLTDPTMMGKYDALIVAIKAAGVWTNMKATYCFKEGTESIHKWNIKDPRDLDAAFRLTFMNTPTHSTSGVDWNGTTQYAKTFFVPNVNFTSKDAKAIGYFSGEDTAATGEMGENDTSNSSFDGMFIKSGGNFAGYVNDLNGTSTANSDASGFYIVTRLNSTQSAFYKNGAALGTNPKASNSAAAQNTSMIELGRANGSFTTAICRFAFIYNGSFTSTNASDLNTAVNTFLA